MSKGLIKDLRKLLEKAKNQGWRIEDRGRRYMAFSPDGVTVVTVAKTPSNQKALEAITRDLRRGGFDPDA
jgi:hypothetical protein